MKKIVKVLGIMLFSAFLLLPLKTNAQEAEWVQKLELGDSVSSAIARVEDGVVVMQYEGAASENNLLIKYDFEGNKIWEIDNDYGYNIESVSDGFVVWSEEKITKFDKDRYIIWSQNVRLQRPTSVNRDNELDDGVVAGLGNKLIELNEFYIIIQTQGAANPHNDIFKFSLNGNLIERIPSDNMFRRHISLDDYRILGVGNSLDKNNLFILYDHGSTSAREIYITNYDTNLNCIQTYTYSIPEIDYPLSPIEFFNGIIKMIETKDGYLAFGRTTMSFTKENKFKINKKMILDVDYIEGNYYAYEIVDCKEDSSLARATIVNYNDKFNELERINLPFYFQSNANNIFEHFYNGYSGFSQTKSRVVFNLNKNKGIQAITLNTPIKQIHRYSSDNDLNIDDMAGKKGYETDINSYSISSYKFKVEEQKEESNSNNPISGIINNITKNPQTNSIIIISVFIIIILAISIASYIIYNKKYKN